MNAVEYKKILGNVRAKVTNPKPYPAPFPIVILQLTFIPIRIQILTVILNPQSDPMMMI